MGNHPTKPIENKTILLIDDEDIIRFSIVDALEDEGYNIIEATNGKEGLDALKKNDPILILVDLRMPIMSGLEFLKKIKPKSSDPFSIIVLTGHGSDNEMYECFELGISVFLNKPFNVLNLRGLVKQNINLKNYQRQLFDCRFQLQEIIEQQDEVIKAKNERLIKQEVELKLGNKESPQTFESANNSDIESNQNELEDQLRQSQKMEAVGQLAGGIAHDFNNILTGIIGYADLSQSSLNDEKATREYLKSILIKSREASQLVRQLMVFSRKQTLTLEKIDLSLHLKESLDFILKALRDNIKINMDMSEEPILIEADAIAVQQILANLLVNAQHAMEDGGSITIRTGTVNLDEEKCLEYEWLEPGAYSHISISDTGTGIEEKYLTKIFDPFFTTKDAEKGTGLGLSMAKNLIQQHRGLIEVESQVGKGTTFRLFFPMFEFEEEKEMDAESATEEFKHGNESILIVENDLDILSIIKIALKKLGYGTLAAPNGLEALKLYRQSETSIALAIVDVFMPEMGGIELLSHLKKLNSDLKYILMSGYSYPENVDIDISNIPYLQKPFTTEQIGKMIRQVLG